MRLKPIMILPLAGLYTFPCLAEDFALTKGQAITVSSDGKVSIKSDLSVELQTMIVARGQPLAKGMLVWLDETGKAHYVVDPELLVKTGN